MQRNEELCLHPWLVWHGYMFGYENLFVIDHGSDDPAVLHTLAYFEGRGVRVMRLPAAADYRRKGELVSFALAQMDGTGLYDLLFPLDCDEFLVMRDEAGALCCDKGKMLEYLATLKGLESPLLVQENLLNAMKNPQGFWPLPYQKVFFAGGQAGVVDHGSHRCLSAPGPGSATRVVYAHFHHKGYETQKRMSREKLRPFVDVEDEAALRAFRGTGWHLVDALFKTEAEYLAMMGGGSEQFPEFPAMLERLGVDPGFCDG